MGNGFIKLYRKFEQWEWYTDNNVKSLFIHCLIKANFKDKKWRGIDIQRGSFITSYDKLSKELHLSTQQIRTSLKKLISTGEVTHETTSKYGLIRVLNYNDYQVVNTLVNIENNKQVTVEQQTSNSRVTTTKNLKNLKNDNKDKNIKNTLPSKSKTIYDEGHMYHQLVSFFLGKRNEIHPSLVNKKENIQKMCDEVRKIVELDKKDIREFAEIIKWIYQDDFWSGQVQSIMKFRKINKASDLKHYDLFLTKLDFDSTRVKKKHGLDFSGLDSFNGF